MEGFPKFDYKSGNTPSIFVSLPRSKEKEKPPPRVADLPEDIEFAVVKILIPICISILGKLRYNSSKPTTTQFKHRLVFWLSRNLTSILFNCHDLKENI